MATIEELEQQNRVYAEYMKINSPEAKIKALEAKMPDLSPAIKTEFQAATTVDQLKAVLVKVYKLV